MDRRLLDVSYPVVELETAVVRLWRDFTHPGRALLIPLAEVREIHDLEAEDYFLLMAELRRLSRVLAGLYQADKMNLACFGNQVPWLHWHVIPRHRDDAQWPLSVWEELPDPSPADDEVLAEHAERLHWALLDDDGEMS
ncbi:MAG TPA: HIT family protein [Alphaproteobacteria bacterium]|jgi:diadenosine tetraphosphate (Ap4A) HIT family hydrolase|nr:HIT family protein [Alphaproteobacteria bacterium]